MIGEPVSSKIPMHVTQPFTLTDEWLREAGGSRDSTHGITNTERKSRKSAELHCNITNGTPEQKERRGQRLLVRFTLLFLGKHDFIRKSILFFQSPPSFSLQLLLNLSLTKICTPLSSFCQVEVQWGALLKFSQEGSVHHWNPGHQALK